MMMNDYRGQHMVFLAMESVIRIKRAYRCSHQTAMWLCLQMYVTGIRSLKYAGNYVRVYGYQRRRNSSIVSSVSEVVYCLSVMNGLEACAVVLLSPKS